jgi:Zn-dependent M28 family amino/carboxypeptidase
MMKKSILILFLGLYVVPIYSQTLQEHYRKHIEFLGSDEMQGRAAATRYDTLTVEYIVAELSAIDGVTLLGDNGIQVVPYRARVSRADTTRISKTTFNVVGLIEAQNPQYRNRTLLLGAHYDHLGKRMVDSVLQVFNGADDNASGTAFIIESARELAKQRERLKANVIVILFGGEEAGLIGSRYYANNPLQPLEEVKAMMNFDMLGRMTANGITVRGLGSAKEALELFGSLKNPDKIDLIFEMRGNGPTDYSSFYSKGIPTFSFSTRQHNDYHRHTDTMEKVNYEGMEIARNYIWQIVEILAFSERMITFKDVMDPVN